MPVEFLKPAQLPGTTPEVGLPAPVCWLGVPPPPPPPAPPPPPPPDPGASVAVPLALLVGPVVPPAIGWPLAPVPCTEPPLLGLPMYLLGGTSEPHALRTSTAASAAAPATVRPVRRNARPPF